jgi:hypothetical protein
MDGERSGTALSHGISLRRAVVWRVLRNRPRCAGIGDFGDSFFNGAMSGPSPGRGCLADNAPERAGEMRLIAHSAVQGNLTERGTRREMRAGIPKVHLNARQKCPTLGRGSSMFSIERSHGCSKRDCCATCAISMRNCETAACAGVAASPVFGSSATDGSSVPSAVA